MDKDVEFLVKTLQEAVEDIKDWAAYSSVYFQDKWGLVESLERYQEVIDKYKSLANSSK